MYSHTSDVKYFDDDIYYSESQRVSKEAKTGQNGQELDEILHLAPWS